MYQRTNERNPRGKYTVSSSFTETIHLFVSLMCFIMAPIWASFAHRPFKNNICICISIQNYQKVNNIANCAIKSLLLKKACPKTIVVSWRQILFRQKLKYVHLQPMNVYGKNSTVKGVNINVDPLVQFSFVLSIKWILDLDVFLTGQVCLSRARTDLIHSASGLSISSAYRRLSSTLRIWNDFYVEVSRCKRNLKDGGPKDSRQTPHVYFAHSFMSREFRDYLQSKVG